jgi:hypothetical protein
MVFGCTKEIKRNKNKCEKIFLNLSLKFKVFCCLISNP